MRAHGARLYQLCRAYLGDTHEAEEATHVVFIKAYQSLGSFRGESAFGTWLFRIGINQCKDLLKARHRRKVESLDARLERPGRVPDSLISRPGHPLGDSEPVSPEAWKRLSQGEKEALLKVAEDPGADYGTLGSEMGLSREGFKGRLKRARMKMQSFLKDRGAR